MSFKTWYHANKLNEDEYVDMPLDDEAPVQQQEMPADKVAPAAAGGFSKYMTETNIKASLQQLGKDIGEALYDFALNKFVSDDMFDSEDNKLKYETEVRNKIAEDYNVKMVEILRNAGIFLNNAKEKYTK